MCDCLIGLWFTGTKIKSPFSQSSELGLYDIGKNGYCDNLFFCNVYCDGKNTGFLDLNSSIWEELISDWVDLGLLGLNNLGKT